MFSARGRGRGSPKRREGGEVDFLFEITGGAVSHEGARGPGGCLQGIGGLNIVLLGPKCPPRQCFDSIRKIVRKTQKRVRKTA